MKLSKIAEIAGGKLKGDGLVEINGVAALDEAKKGTIAFFADLKSKKKLSESNASAFIVPQCVEFNEKPLIICISPKLAFISVINIFHPPPVSTGIDLDSYIAKDAIIGNEVTIYPNVYVADGAVIGDRVSLYPGVHVGRKSQIGNDSTLYPNVVVMDESILGERVVIHGGTVIGSDGYGFVWDGKQHIKVPQIGRVVIECDVEIGANCTIDRGSLGKTIIKQGTKIDNLVHIAHNCMIGENSLLAGQVGLAGSVKLGRNTILAGQVGVSDHVTIGDGVTVGGRSGVTKKLEDGAFVTGYPTLPHREWLKVQKSLEKLPSLRKEIKNLTRKIEKLEKSEA